MGVPLHCSAGSPAVEISIPDLAIASRSLYLLPGGRTSRGSRTATTYEFGAAASPRSSRSSSTPGYANASRYSMSRHRQPDFLGGLALGQVGRKRTKTRARSSSRPRPTAANKTFPVSVTPNLSPRRHTHREVHLVRRSIHHHSDPRAVLLTGVIGDHLLVQLLKTSHGNLSK